MTASILTRLPVMAGAAALSGTGRAGGWALSQFMRAPMANTGMAAMATLIALASTNALYNQTMPHPAPFFAAPPNVPTPVAARPDTDLQVIPPVEAVPETQKAVPAATEPAPRETTGSIDSDGPAGNSDVYEVQRKLTELGHYEGVLDGLYGPNTARAIRAFEEHRGLQPEGALNDEVVEAILSSSASDALPGAGDVEVTQAAATGGPEAAEITTASSGSSTHAANQTIDSIVAALGGTGNTQSSPAPIEAEAQEPVERVAAFQPMPELIETEEAAEASAPQLPPIDTSRVGPPATNEELVTRIQRGLASLGFLHGAIDGEPGDATARAIRNFEVYYNYRVTGEIRPELVEMLTQAGASV